MVDEFLESAKREQKRLKAEFENNPSYQRLLWVEEFIANHATANKVPTKRINGLSQNGIDDLLFKSKKDAVEYHAKEYIKENNGAATLRDIHDCLEKKGYPLKLNTLSAYLSNGKEAMKTTYNEETKTWSAL